MATPIATPLATSEPSAAPSPEPTATATLEPARPTAVTVSPSTADLTALGSKAQLMAEVRDQHFTVMNGAAVTWTTSANLVATVDASGVVTAEGNGTAMITASAGSASGTVVVTVRQAVASVEVSPSVVELASWGETVQLSALALDANGHAVMGAVFSWESADVPVATVDASGMVTAASNGTATITASTGTASGSGVMQVTQTASSVEVSPSVVELTSWGETVQLTAAAVDAHGHPVAGAEFLWETTDALVAAVDANGLVSGTGGGVAKITARAGTASGTATVTAPTAFTLSGTVSDSRRNVPALSGAIVRLENGQQEYITIGPDGRYRFQNVYGTVTVAVSNGRTHVAESVEITLDEDRKLDFDLEHTGVPPWWQTTLIAGRIIEPSDPSMLGGVTYEGRGQRRVFDRRPRSWISIDAYLFDVGYAGQVVEFRVNPEFGSKEAAQAEVEKYAHALGQMPTVLLSSIRYVNINAGSKVWLAHGDGGILIHTGFATTSVLEEVMFHEATHVALDPAHSDSPGWRTAQSADGVFISTYARDYPDREDIAESFLLYFAVRHKPESITPSNRAVILRTMPNRLAYFDEQGFDMSPYTSTEVQ